MADIGMVIGQLAGLRGDGLGDLGPSIADIDAIEAGEGVQRRAPLAVGDPHPAGPGDDPVADLAPGELAQMGRGMEEVIVIPLGQLIIGQGLVHGGILSRAGRQAQSRQTYLTSVKASRPRREPSRPRPDCFMPPKGIGAPVTLVRFTATMPKRSARLAR